MLTYSDIENKELLNLQTQIIDELNFAKLIKINI